MINILFFISNKILQLFRFLHKKKVHIWTMPLYSYFLLFITIDTLFPFRFHKDYSRLVYSNDKHLIGAYLSEDDKWRMQTHLSEVSPKFTKAILNKEDKYFYYHFGVNPIAIFRAGWQNITSGKRKSGASTITMQLARMLYPKERSFFNKFREMFHAMQLEWHYSKDEILEMYMSLLPYGGNVEGVKAASHIYFNKSPKNLSLSECISLAIIPNRPNSLRPDKSVDELIKSRNLWIKRFIEMQTFDKSELEEARSEPIESQRFAAPSFAPHLSRKLLIESDKNVIFSTLKLEIQQKVHDLCKSYSKQMQTQQIENLAAIVIDNKTHSVVAYVGSHDFNDFDHSGQVDGVQAIRSPGSTLKPLLYALAMEEGLITPKSKLLDIPVDFYGYNPENYDGTFAGEVTAEYALAMSLNLPAVRLLNEIGVNYFIKTLIQANFKTVEKQKDELGHSVILGGCGTNLEELATLYQAFANQGRFYPIKYQYFQEEAKIHDFKIISPAAAYLLANILSKAQRPDLPLNYSNALDIPKIAWKTGTSYGRRDAWSIGYNPNYTIGVWLGNFSGEGVPDMTGSNTATPLLFNIFNALERNKTTTWFKQAPELKVRKVCEKTGKIPSKHCENIIYDYFIENVSSIDICDLKQKFYIKDDSSMIYCSKCLPNEGYKKVWLEVYPPELLGFSEIINIETPEIPPHNPDCERVFKSKGPTIISPSQHSEYLLLHPGEQKILLKASSENFIKKHYWYINDVFFKAVNAGEKVFFTPQVGKTKISCQDDLGRVTQINISFKNELK